MNRYILLNHSFVTCRHLLIIIIHRNEKIGNEKEKK